MVRAAANGARACVSASVLITPKSMCRVAARGSPGAGPRSVWRARRGRRRRAHTKNNARAQVQACLCERARRPDAAPAAAASLVIATAARARGLEYYNAPRGQEYSRKSMRQQLPLPRAGRRRAEAGGAAPCRGGVTCGRSAAEARAGVI